MDTERENAAAQSAYVWDRYFISEAYLAAHKSKDRSTQVGAVVVGPDREIRSKGYNGPPRGFDDDDPAIHERPLKYSLFCHAEENSIAAAARIGVSLKGCALYVTAPPCANCARMIVQSGITEVVVHAESPVASGKLPGWRETVQISERIFRECGVTLRSWSGRPLLMDILVNGERHGLPPVP